MNMDVYEAIYSRRTVRDFEDKKVDMDTVKKILDAGLHAPSNNHMREWEFIILDDRATRPKAIDKVEKNMTREEIEKLLDSWECFDERQREMYFNAIPKQYRMLLTAGCLIIPCFRQKWPLLKSDSLSALNGFASIWCCIENILIAAAAEGIYGVTRIPFDEESKHLKAVLNVPEDYEIPCYIALGYPDKNAKPVKQHAISAEERIHFNKW
jgi:nitroreductase